eukprot:3001081-Pyramimonas_sp.AAC.1
MHQDGIACCFLSLQRQPFTENRALDILSAYLGGELRLFRTVHAGGQCLALAGLKPQPPLGVWCVPPTGAGLTPQPSLGVWCVPPTGAGLTPQPPW